jgi:4-alpha-glucanotransferase
MVGDRVVHQDWDDTPVWRPDAQGIIRNNDFFGGSLAGITSRLDYLQSMGVGTLYLCPIFESDSNHRYDTADYRRIDPMLGTEEDFRTLCREAGCRGIRVMLDGVFNHTGSNSRYFNAQGFYPELGAAQSRESQYYNWYSFHPWPEDYDAWWGIKTLPAVQESADSYRRFIIRDGDSVVRHWLRQGASGWRLDVADELPDNFIEEIRAAMEQEKPDSFLLGEVWEDGSNKIAYSRRRKYLLGRETHGLMNYPLRTAALDYLRGGDAAAFRDAMEEQRENYPPAAFYSGLNILGTHDTPRILTLLGADTIPDSKEARAAYHLSPEARRLAVRRLTLAAMLLYTFPGSPTLYYGDEAGMEGFEDPMNRQGFPWGREDQRLLTLYRTLGRLRKERESLQSGDLTYLTAEGGLLIFCRKAGGERTYTALNTGDTPRDVTLPWPNGFAVDAVTLQRFWVRDGMLRLTLPPCDGVILV